MRLRTEEAATEAVTRRPDRPGRGGRFSKKRLCCATPTCCSSSRSNRSGPRSSRSARPWPRPPPQSRRTTPARRPTRRPHRASRRASARASPSPASQRLLSTSSARPQRSRRARYPLASSVTAHGAAPPPLTLPVQTTTSPAASGQRYGLRWRAFPAATAAALTAAEAAAMYPSMRSLSTMATRPPPASSQRPISSASSRLTSRSPMAPASTSCARLQRLR